MVTIIVIIKTGEGRKEINGERRTTATATIKMAAITKASGEEEKVEDRCLFGVFSLKQRLVQVYEYVRK